MENHDPTINVQIASPKTNNESYQRTQVTSYEVRTVTSKEIFCKKGAASIIDIKLMRLIPSLVETLHLRYLSLGNV